MRLPLTLVVLAGALLGAVAGASADETPRLLVLSGATPGSDEIHWVSSSGGSTKPLTRHPPQGVLPAWSPDGRTIAFTAVDADADYAEGVWLASMEGGARRLVRLGAGDPAVSTWSPNGRRLAVTDFSTLWLVDARTGKRRRLADVNQEFADQAWSPDGRRIAFSACPGRGDASCGLYVVDVQTRRLTRLTRRLTAKEVSNEVGMRAPAWSPDGKRIVASKGDGESMEIIVVNSRRRGERVIGTGFQPVWVSRTTVATLAFSGEFNDHVRLLRIGGRARRIGDPPGKEFALGWSPRARRLLFASLRSGGRVALYQADPRGRGYSRLRRPAGRVRGSQNWSPLGDRLAFDYRETIREEEYVFRIGVQDIAGRRSELVQPASDSTAVPSPQGTKIAFTRHTGRHASLFVMNADGSGARRLAAGRAPQWTPSGQTIVFARGGEVRTISADGAGERRLANGFDPTVSPDGRQVAFAWGASVYAIDIEGGVQRLLYRFQLNRACHPSLSDTAWSPDGRRIAFSIDYDGDTDDVECSDLASGIIHVLDLQDGTFRSISAGVGLRWSPDGTRLLVDETDIVVMRADGTERRKLAGANASNPAWSPDGRFVAFDRVVGKEANVTDVWIIGADGSVAHRLTTDAASSSPMWLP
jgi:Tol biopolymer transport system component